MSKAPCKFEVGVTYHWSESGFDPVTVTKRTDKTIWVQRDDHGWMMRIKHDPEGNEFAVDSSMTRISRKFVDSFTLDAKYGRR